ncbi:MAG: hypothetical protein ACYDBJ_28155 [Aggregatilineales bacterium]
MQFKVVHLLTFIAVLVALPFATQASAQIGGNPTPGVTMNATASLTISAPNCAMLPTAVATENRGATPMATATVSATTQATAQAVATVIATASADSPLRFNSFLPTDFRFNPNPDKPVALIMVFSLIFQNERDDALTVQHPRFQLAIDDVPMGDLTSSDFQTGSLNPHATEGIVLQTLLLVPRATDSQKLVLECIKNGVPVDLSLYGTIETYPGGTKQIVNVSLLTPQTVIRAHQSP